MKLSIPAILLLLSLTTLFGDNNYTPSIGVSLGRSFSGKFGSEPSRWVAGNSNFYSLNFRSEVGMRDRFSYGACLELSYSNFPTDGEKSDRPDYIFYHTDDSYDYDYNHKPIKFTYRENRRGRGLLKPFISLNNLGKVNIQFGIPVGYTYLHIPKMKAKYEGRNVMDTPSIENISFTFGLELEIGYMIENNFKINFTNTLMLSGKNEEIVATEYNYIDGEQIELDNKLEVETGILSYNLSLGLDYYF